MKDYKEAKLKLADLAPNKVRWFSVEKDGYPPFNGAVLVTGHGRYGTFVDVSVFANGDWDGFNGSIQKDDNIVGWAWLPVPFEEDTCDGAEMD